MLAFFDTSMTTLNSERRGSEARAVVLCTSTH